MMSPSDGKNVWAAGEVVKGEVVGVSVDVNRFNGREQSDECNIETKRH